jgi:hypothetical protein
MELRNREVLLRVGAAVAWAGLAALLVYALWYHAEIIRFPQQWEYREGALLVQVRALDAGIGLYAPENLPQYANVYGWLYPALASLLSPGDPGFAFLRLISAAGMWGATLLVYREARSSGASTLLAAALALALYTQLLHFVIPYARPDGIGVLIYVGALVLGARSKPGFPAAIGIFVLGVLGFLAKAYFILVIPLVFAYWILFVDWRKGLLLGALAAAATVVFLVGLDRWVPAYFTATIFSQHRGAMQGANWHHLVAQLKPYSQASAGLLLLLVVGLVAAPPRSRRDMPFPVFAALFAAAALLGKLGHSQGAFLTYFIELLTPPLVLSIAVLLARGTPRLAQGPLVPAAVLGAAAYGVGILFTPSADLSHWKRDYVAAAQLTDGYPKVFATPMLAGYLAQTQREVFDNGQNEYIGSDSVLAGNPWGFGVPQAELVRVVHAFETRVRERLEQRDFDLVVTDSSAPQLPWFPMLQANYVVSREASIGRADLKYWVPRRQ